MTIQSASTERSAGQAPAGQVPASPEQSEFPVREYIGAMAVELAQMARWDGDEDLGRLLDAAAARAGEVLQPHPTELNQAGGRRTA